MSPVYKTLLLLAATTLVSSDNESHQRVRVDDYGESVTLTCTERQDINFRHWVLPDVDKLVDRQYTGTEMVLLSNWSLHIVSAQREDMGDYLCLVSFGDDDMYYKTSLYQQTPNVWGGYRHGGIVGGAAAAAAFVIFTLICVFDAREHRNHEKEPAKEQVTERVTELDQDVNGYDNEAYRVNDQKGSLRYHVSGPIVINTAM